MTSYLIYNCQAAPLCFLSLTCLLLTRQYKGDPLYINMSHSVLDTAFCLHSIYLVWDINLCWQCVFLKHS